VNLNEAIRTEVRAAVHEVLDPFLPKLARPDCRTYTFGQAAQVIGCSDRHVAKLVNRGVLPLVPELGTRKLIPRVAVEQFVDGRETPASFRSGGVGDAGISEPVRAAS
jgi:excisionase family DNA binding protein